MTTKHDISSDGITVWVNGEGGLIGRFGKMGIDIHRPMSEQLTQGECLYCTHAPTTAEDWPVFVQKMDEYFKIRVPNKYKPDRFR